MKLSVRSAVKDYLSSGPTPTICPSFTGGFFEPYIATSNTTKPFGVVKVAGDDGSIGHGAVKTIQVMCHAERAGFDDLDDLVYEVIKALDNVEVPCGTTGTGEDLVAWSVIPHYTGTSGDWADDDRETIVRTCEFEVVIAR